MFDDVRFWKRLGEEYGEPLIITGTVVFRAQPHGGSVEPVFLFIDSRTGVVIYSATFREKLSHGDRRRVPAFSTYFQLMDTTIGPVRLADGNREATSVPLARASVRVLILPA